MLVAYKIVYYFIQALKFEKPDSNIININFEISNTEISSCTFIHVETLRPFNFSILTLDCLHRSVP